MVSSKILVAKNANTRPTILFLFPMLFFRTFEVLSIANEDLSIVRQLWRKKQFAEFVDCQLIRTLQGKVLKYTHDHDHKKSHKTPWWKIKKQPQWKTYRGIGFVYLFLGIANLAMFSDIHTKWVLASGLVWVGLSIHHLIFAVRKYVKDGHCCRCRKPHEVAKPFFEGPACLLICKNCLTQVGRAFVESKKEPRPP